MNCKEISFVTIALSSLSLLDESKQNKKKKILMEYEWTFMNSSLNISNKKKNNILILYFNV